MVDSKTLIESAVKFVRHKMWREALDCLAGAYKQNRWLTIKPLREFRAFLSQEMKYTEDSGLMPLLREAYFLSARDYFDDFCIALEWDRPYAEKFYLPRRKQLVRVTNALQKLADGEIKLLCISMPPGVGKTGLAVFFLLFLVGRDPYHGILSASHNASFLRGLYEECLRELDADGDYRFFEIFPERKIAKTNALDMKIDIDKASRFSSLQFTSVGAGNAGKVRAIQLLYCDDLIEGMEEAISIERLDKKWTNYTVDLRQRKQGNCAELHIATRWSVNDVIGRLEREYGDDTSAMFIAVPALNASGESNFDYGGKIGFSTKMYEDLRDRMDDVSWRALYMNQPIEREGLLYEKDTLRRYYELPTEAPDAILAVCDTANGGGDYTVMPVFYVYGTDHYMVDCVCSNDVPDVVDRMCAEMLVKWRVKTCQFESNNAGGRTADNVEKMVREMCEKAKQPYTNITKRHSEANKETKIIVNSPFVKNHVLFLDESKIPRRSMYQSFMYQLCSYSRVTKNKHDDVPDALAQYSIFTDSLVMNRAVVMQMPW